MSLLSPLFERRSTGDTVNLTSGDPELSNFFGTTSSNSAQNVTADTAVNISAVYACVNRKAKTLAMLPLNVMRRLPNGGKEVATDHRLYRQLNARPNRWQTSYDWRLMCHSHMLLRGNSYSRIVYHPGRGINELIPMDPNRTFPFMIDTSGGLNYMNDNSPAPSQGDKLWYQYIRSDG
ncbi:phage portal protein, partial [bacterium]|nr:phage portal protein [bacterium]